MSKGPYRGKSLYGKWLKGPHCQIDNKHFICPEPYDIGFKGGEVLKINIAGWIEVIPESVGQSTGRLDDDDIAIYNGDILQSFHFTDQSGKAHYLYHIVQWSIRHDGWVTCAVSERNKPEGEREGSPPLWVYMKNSRDIKIIGNVTDNPKLLEQDE